LHHFWRKKLVGVYFPFLLVELLFSIILKRPFWDIVLDVTLVDIAYPYGWYMWYLFLCYAVFWLTFRFLSSVRLRLFLLGALAIFSFFFFEGLQGEQALSFFAGVLWGTYDARVCERFSLKEKNSYRKLTPKARTALLGGALLLLFVLLLAIKQIPAVRGQHPYLLTLLNLSMKFSCAVGILLVTWVLHPLARIIFHFGTISYPLYLTHGYFMFVVTENLLGGYILSSLLMVLISFTAATFLHYIILGAELLVKRMHAAR
jgi:peptidoglycan/LPS O-acetylase OafA/YrhL